MRNLKVTKAIGSCESNHRKYTYRVKGQGKYWSEAGAEGMLRILTCIKNRDLEQWLNSDFEAGKLISLDHKKLLAAARDSLKRRHEDSPSLIFGHFKFRSSWPFCLTLSVALNFKSGTLFFIVIPKKVLQKLKKRYTKSVK